MKVIIPIIKVGAFVHKDSIQIGPYSRGWILLLMFPFSFAYFSKGRYDIEWNIFKKFKLRVWDKKEKEWLENKNGIQALISYYRKEKRIK